MGTPTGTLFTIGSLFLRQILPDSYRQYLPEFQAKKSRIDIWKRSRKMNCNNMLLILYIFDNFLSDFLTLILI
jgi:hypothetical protein